MKKTIGVFTTALLASSVVLAASTGTLLIQGSVALVNDITITANSNATSLSITGGESNKLVATVSESSNNLNGYKIFLKSVNASKLMNTSDNTKFTGYTISYNGGSAVTLTTTDQEVKNVSSLSGLTTNSSNVNVNVTSYASAPAGTYNDTITVSIVAN